MAAVQMGSESKALPTTSECAAGKLYSYSFLDPELKESRRSLINTLVLPVVYLSVSMCGVLGLFWGSTTFSSLNQLSVQVTNLDNGGFGTQVLGRNQYVNYQL
jgi:hypothetical protein